MQKAFLELFCSHDVTLDLSQTGYRKNVTIQVLLLSQTVIVSFDHVTYMYRVNHL